MMDQETLQALIVSTSQSAAAAVEAVRLLKEEKEKGKGQGFGSASKVLNQPEVFSPTNQEEEISQWQDWRLTFRSWLTFADAGYEKDLGGDVC